MSALILNTNKHKLNWTKRIIQDLLEDMSIISSYTLPSSKISDEYRDYILKHNRYNNNNNNSNK